MCNKNVFRYVTIIVKQIKITEPMKHFIQEEKKPSGKTLSIIRQIAYTYRVMKLNGQNEVYCLN